MFDLDTMSHSDFLAELKEKHFAVARLPKSAIPLLEEARRRVDFTPNVSRDGIFVPSPMPEEFVKLQTLRPLRRVFQSVYPIEHITFSFDVGQYVAPGEPNLYRGIVPDRKHTDLVALIALSEQRHASLHLKPGDVVFYSMKHFDGDRRLFSDRNDQDHAWVGLFTGFWPVSYDTYGRKQRELMLRSGECGLLLSKENKTAYPVRDLDYFLDEETRRSVLQHKLSAYQQLYHFDAADSRVRRCHNKWIEGVLHDDDNTVGSVVPVSDTDVEEPRDEEREEHLERAMKLVRKRNEPDTPPGRSFWMSSPAKKKPVLDDSSQRRDETEPVKKKTVGRRHRRAHRPSSQCHGSQQAEL